MISYCFTSEFYQNLRKKMTGILHKHFQKIEEGVFSSSFCETKKTMTFKRDENITKKKKRKKEITDQFFHENMHKIH